MLSPLPLARDKVWVRGGLEALYLTAPVEIMSDRTSPRFVVQLASKFGSVTFDLHGLSVLRAHGHGTEVCNTDRAGCPSHS